MPSALSTAGRLQVHWSIDFTQALCFKMIKNICATISADANVIKLKLLWWDVSDK